MMPPGLLKWYSDAIMGNVALMKDILRNFNRDDINRIIPDVTEILKQLPSGGANGQSNQGSGSQIQQSPQPIPGGGFPTASTIPQ